MGKYIGAFASIDKVNARKKQRSTVSSTVKEKETNAGGLLGGIGYTAERLGLGVLQGVEGAADYVVGGVADLLGADDFAEDVFDDDWVDYGHADEWYNPSGAMQVVGDVAGGIGSTVPAIGAAVGGAAAPAAIKMLAATAAPLVAGVSAAGNATKEAYRETGELTGKEYGYGALVGATEAGVEALTAGIAKGSGRLMSSILRKGAGEAAESVTKSGVRGVLKALGEDMVSEGFEEGLATAVAPLYARATYDPDAAWATPGEIGYDAFIGSMSGLVLGGVGQVSNYTGKVRAGKKVSKAGKAEALVKQSKRGLSALRAEANTLTSRAEAVAGDTEMGRIERFRTKREVSRANERVTEAADAVAENLARWEALSEAERTSSRGYAVLGELQQNSFLLRANEWVAARVEGMTALSDEALTDMAEQIREATGATYTVEELRADKDDVLSRIAANEWVIGKMTGAREEQAPPLPNGDGVQAGEDLPQGAGAVAGGEVDTRDASGLVGQNDGTRAVRAEAEAQPIKYSIEKTTDGRSVAVVDEDILDGIYTGTWDKATKEKAKKAAKEALNQFKGGIKVYGLEGSPLIAKVNKISRNEYTRSQYSEALYRNDPDTYADKMRASSVADDMVTATTGWAKDGGLAHHRTDFFEDFAKGKTLIRSGSKLYEAEVIVGITGRGEYVFYDVVDMHPASNTKKTGVLSAVTPTQSKSFDAILGTPATDSIAQTEAVVKRENAEGGRVLRAEGVNVHKFTDAQYAAYKAAEIMARSLGTDIVIHESLGQTADGKAINGYFDPKDGRIHININAMRDGKQIALYTLAHEVTHAIKEWSPAKYGELERFVMARLGADADATVKRKLEQMRKAGLIKEKISESEAYEPAREEVVADGMEGVLADGKVLEALARENRTLWEKIKDVVTAVIAKVKKIYGNLNKLSQTARVLTDTVESLETLEQLFYEAASDAGKNRKMARESGLDGKSSLGKIGGDTIRYSSMNDLSLEDNVDRIIEMSDEDARRNKEEGNFVSIMKETPDVIMDNVEGAENLEIIMRFDSFYLATRHDGVLEGHYHNYGEIMKRLPEIIADPEAVVRMDNGRLNLLTTVKTAKGNYSIVSIELNTVKDVNSKNTKYNMVMSVIPAKDNYMRNNLVNHGVKVEYQKEDLSQVNHQLHEWLAIVNDRSSEDLSQVNNQLHKWLATVNERSSANSIAQNGEVVKQKFSIESDSSAEVDTDATEDEVARIRAEAETEIKRIRAEADAKVKEARAQRNREVKYANDTARRRIHKEKEQRREREAKARARADERVRREHDRADERIESWRERRQETHDRHSLRRSMSRLYKRLLSPTKERNVPESLRAAVAEAMAALNMDVKGIDQMAEIEAELEKLYREDAPNEEKIGKLAYKLEEHAATLKEQTAALLEAYEAASKEEGSPLAAEITDKLKELRAEIGDTGIYQMNRDQLRAARDFYDMILHQVSAANKLFAEERAAAIDQTGRRITEEMQAAKVPKLLQPKAGEPKAISTARRYLWQMLKPIQVFDVLGSDTLSRVFASLRHGEDVYATDVAEARDKFAESAKKHGYWDWDMDTRHEFATANGKTVKLTTGQMMSLYAYSKREQAHQHLREGGFTFAPDATYKGKLFDKEGARKWGITLERMIHDAQRYTLTEAEFGKIANALTAEQKAFAEEMQEYLSKDMAAKGNEVSLKLYGIKLFGEAHYWPIKSSKEYIDSETGKVGDPKVKNKGITKRVTTGAGNPLVLQDFMEVWNGHINEMALYHGMVLPMEDMNRLLNYKPGGDLSQAEAEVAFANAAVNSNIVDLIQQVKNGTSKANDKVYLENATPEVAKRIQEITGVDVTGFKVAIEARQLEHILKDHGENGITDHSMSSDDTIAKIEFALKNPDEISSAGKTKAYWHMKDGYNRTSDTVLYEKKIGDKSYYVVQAVADTKAKTLFIVSSFIGKSGNKKGGPQLTDAQRPGATSETAIAGVPNNSIPQSSEKINTSKEKTSGTDKYASLKELIRKQYGDEATLYIEQLLRDLNGGARSGVPTSAIDKGLSLFKKTATMASASVTFQQPSSIARAWSMIHYKYFANKGYNPATSRALYEELKKYAPVAIIKEMGGFDTGVGQATGDYIMERDYALKDKPAAFAKDKAYRDRVFGYGAVKADQLAWLGLWEACKREAADRYRKERGAKAAATRDGVQAGMTKIRVGMTDAERAAVLRGQKITPTEIRADEGFDVDWDALAKNRWDIVKKPLLQKMREMGHLRHYATDSIDIEFDFTGEGLRKSMNSQVSDYGGTLGDLAKVVMNMQGLLDSAVLLEVHADKAKGTPKENKQLVQTYVLLSAFREGNAVTPVQFEVKQYVDDNNRLYLAVAMTKIETGVINDTIQGNSSASTRLLPVSDISIPQLIQKINPRDENFFKYVPDELLTVQQRAAKGRALEKEDAKYGRQQNRGAANRSSTGLSRPVGNAITNSSSESEASSARNGLQLSTPPKNPNSNTNIAQNSEKINTSSENISEEEAILRMAGERFTEVVVRTQVYDSTLSRSGMMRSKDTGWKMATAFMAEPTTVVNMMVDAMVRASRGDKRAAGHIAGSVAVSILLNAVLASLVYAARDDDEEKHYLEKYVEALGGELADGFNPLTMLPYAKDIWSLAQGYDIERSDMAAWADLIRAVQGMGSDTKTWAERWMTLGANVGTMFGLPTRNLYRDARGIRNVVTNFGGDGLTKAGAAYAWNDGVWGQVPLAKLFGVKTDISDGFQLYEALTHDDTEHYERVLTRFETQAKAEAALRVALRDNDKRIRTAAQARYEGDMATYSALVKEIKAEGHFTQDMIVTAINGELSEIKRDAEAGVATVEDDTEETEGSIYTAADLNGQLEEGDDTEAQTVLEDMIAAKVAAGKTKKQAQAAVKSSVTRYWKEKYVAARAAKDVAEQKRIRDILKQTGLYGTASEVRETVESWVKESKKK